jgi:PEGA domain-containing protein
VALARPAVQPVFVRTPQVTGDQAAQAVFEAESRRHGWTPALTVDVATAPQPHAAAALQSALAAMGELRFQDALRDLDRAADDAVLTGAAGLTTAQLADVYLYRGIVRRKLLPSETSSAWEDFVRAATFNPERVLDPGRVPPAALDAWNRAVAEVQRRAQGALIVRGPAEATISIDGRPAVRSPALSPGLSHGEHLIRVEEPGHLPWAASVPLAGPTLELEVPVRPELALDDAAAADLARRSDAAFALVAQQKPRRGDPVLELRLVETASRQRRLVSLVTLSGAGELRAAVDRMAGAARASEPGARPAPPSLIASAPPAPPPSRSRLAAGLVLAGALAAGLVAGILIDNARRDGQSRAGFPTTLVLPDR